MQLDKKRRGELTLKVILHAGDQKEGAEQKKEDARDTADHSWKQNPPRGIPKGGGRRVILFFFLPHTENPLLYGFASSSHLTVRVPCPSPT